MIAAFPMYDRPETASANDRLWVLIREALGFGPTQLRRGGEVWHIWTAPDLMLAQTCGLPFRARLHDRVTLVGTPDYGLAGLPPGYYQSVLIARAEDARDLDELGAGTLAYNEALSQSGWAAPQAHGLRPAHLVQTGAHRASALAVAERRADIAALDAVTWALIQRHDPFAARLRVVARTAPSPGLPLITAKGVDPAPLRLAVEAGISALSPDDRDTLLLIGLAQIPVENYLALPIPTAPAE